MSSAKGAQIDAPLLKVGMLGAGVVGGQVARLLVEQNSDLAARSGSQLQLVAISVKDLKKPRPGLTNSGVSVTSDGESIVNDPQIDIVIEVMGGIEPARSLILQALKNGNQLLPQTKHYSHNMVQNFMKPLQIMVLTFTLRQLLLEQSQLLGHFVNHLPEIKLNV